MLTSEGSSSSFGSSFMRRPTSARSRRPGASALLMVMVMSILIGMVAFAVDAGWMVLAQGDLQSAADAAALAGAQQLLGQPTLNNASGFYNLTNGFNQYYAPGQTSGNKTAIVNAATAAAKA